MPFGRQVKRLAAKAKRGPLHLLFWLVVGLAGGIPHGSLDAVFWAPLPNGANAPFALSRLDTSAYKQADSASVGLAYCSPTQSETIFPAISISKHLTSRGSHRLVEALDPVRWLAPSSRRPRLGMRNGAKLGKSWPARVATCARETMTQIIMVIMRIIVAEFGEKLELRDGGLVG